MLPLDTDIELDSEATAEVVEEVLALEEQLYDGPERNQAKVARRILELDPIHIDALVMLACSTSAMTEKLALLREAIRIGNKQWEPVIERGEEVSWWWDIDTRPFMRAIRCYADELAQVGRVEEANTCYRTLIEMEPGDSLGARVFLTQEDSAAPPLT